MIGLERREDRDRRRDGKERAVELVRFHDDEIALAEPRVGAGESAQPAAHDDGRIDPALHQHQADHGGRRGLPVRAGDADAVLQAHDLGEHLRPADHRDLPLLRFDQLRVVRTARRRSRRPRRRPARGSRRRARCRRCAPSSFSRSVLSLAARSDPVTANPWSIRISAMPLIPMPPMPDEVQFLDR